MAMRCEGVGDGLFEQDFEEVGGILGEGDELVTPAEEVIVALVEEGRVVVGGVGGLGS